MYYSVTGDKQRDYTYKATGDYDLQTIRDEEFPMYRRRKGPKRQSGPGKVCPGCGLTRSRMNKCECNS